MLRLFSPAKINLFLRIVSRRSDGYHNLSSVFQTLSLGDTLIIELNDRDELSCEDPHLPIDSTNLILKATKLFRAKTGLNLGFKIQLVKRIPVRAGLGGASSNAATTLWACNQLANTNLSIYTLKQWGSEIGSDVPFFFSQGTAYCTGRGEKVYHLPAFAHHSVWIVKPLEGLSTPEVYKKLSFMHTFSKKAIKNDLERFLSNSLPHFNDLEQPAFVINPQLYRLKSLLLDSGFEVVVMSGSGSAFFCLGQGNLPKGNNLLTFPAQYINRSLSSWYVDLS